MYRSGKFLLFFLIISNFCIAQSVQPVFGDEIKLKQGSTNFDIIHMDNSGIYVEESHIALRTYFVFGATTRNAATLVKFDKNLSEVFSTNFNKELKGKNFEKIIPVNGKLFLIASSFKKTENRMDFFAVEIDKNTGQMKKDWKPVFEIGKRGDKSDINYIMTSNADTTALVMISSRETDSDVTFSFKMFDDKMESIKTPVEIKYEVSPKKFEAQNLFFTKGGNILLINKILDYKEGKKEKDRNLEFKEFDIKLYSIEGKLIKQINTTSINGKYLVQSHLKENKDGNFTLGAFYSDKRNISRISGIYFCTINQNTGEISNESSQELTTAQLSQMEADDDDDDEESAKEARERKRLEKLQKKDKNLSSTFKFRDFLHSPEGGFIVLAEKHYFYTDLITGSNGQMRSVLHEVYGDLVLIKISAANNVEWLNMLPKQQDMVIRSSDRSTSGFSIGTYVTRLLQTYGSIGNYYHENTGNFLLLFNDHSKNDKVLNIGQLIRVMQNPDKSNVNMLVVDPKTGKYKRKVLYSNKDQINSMPVTGVQIDKNFFMICKKWNKGFGKAKIALAKLTVK